jgi:ATP synthase I chain
VPEDLLTRVHRVAIAVCAAMAAVGFLVYPGGWRGGAAVLGGGLVSEISFLSIRGAIDDMAARRRAGRAVLRIAGRYALLGFLAYVMIARLRLPPLGLIAGASSVVAAATAEAIRFLLTKKRSDFS